MKVVRCLSIEISQRWKCGKYIYEMFFTYEEKMRFANKWMELKLRNREMKTTCSL